jgi:FAD/FMN-containing dehydrogenase
LLRRAGLAVLASGAAAAWPELAVAAPPEGRLRQLARSLDGELVTRSSPGYRRAKQLYDPRFDTIRPLAIAYCETVEDVEKAVSWGRRNGVRPVPRSGGHSYGGYSTGDGALVVDVRRLDAVSSSSGRARVGAGTTHGKLYEALWRNGVTVPAGSCASVGVSGLTLGGGVGLSSRKLGLTCDSLEALTVVTANGEAVTCSERERPDLFWACRGGGGGNFGVVTDLVFRTHSVSTVSTYTAAWPWSRAGAVVAAWQDWAPDAPPELFSVCRLSAGPGSLRVASSGQLFGTPAELHALLAPLLAAGGEPTSLNVVERSYISAVDYFSGSGGRASFLAKSDYVRERLSEDGIRTLVQAIDRSAGTRGFSSRSALLDSYGGAINEVSPAAAAFVHRGMRFSIQYLAFLSSGDGAASLAWLRALYRAMRPFVSGFAYQNYIDPDLAGWRQAYYGSNLPRLVQIKRRYDPDNLFRFRQSIPAR